MNELHKLLELVKEDPFRDARDTAEQMNLIYIFTDNPKYEHVYLWRVGFYASGWYMDIKYADGSVTKRTVPYGTFQQAWNSLPDDFNVISASDHSKLNPNK